MPPVLRTPPFPGVAAAIAAVSVPRPEGQSAQAEIDAGTIADLFAAIRAARVGGSFWAGRDQGTAPIAVMRPASQADVAPMRAEIGNASVMVLLPRAPWARREAARLRGEGAEVAVGEINVWPLLDRATAVHLHGDDELAALASIAGVSVHIHAPGRFGAPSSSQAEIAGLVARNLIGNTSYRDPFTDTATSIVGTIERLAEWRTLIDANRGIAAAHGFAWWKRKEMERFLWACRPAALPFARSRRHALAVARRSGGGLAVWPSRISPALRAEAAAAGVPLIRVEDGFVRSVGLGSALFPPLSVTVDRRGIHYDPSTPSDLEHLLQNARFDDRLLARAEALLASILASGISKYNAGGDHVFPERASPRRRLVLVPGQVEDDMSVLLGGGGLASNLELLRRARRLEPDAEIWFRPHPDVDAGHRRGAVADADALQQADRIVRGGGMAGLLDIVDDVHVLTSLTGFEALLRKRDVTTHGMPFYAGWGLTRDRGDVPARRTRELSLVELVAGVLILYPRYLDPVTGLPCPPEILVGRVAGKFAPRDNLLTGVRRLQGRLMRGWR